jgi:hypothetical protein
MPTTAGYDAGKSFSVVFSSPNANTAAVKVKDLTANKAIYITDLIISSAAAMGVQLQDSDGTAVTSQIDISASAPFDHAFKTALPVTSEKALMVKTTIAAEIHLTVIGYIK